MKKQSLSDSKNIILDIYQWRKYLITFTLIASVLAAVISSPFFIAPQFKSTAVIYPTTTNSISQALLVKHNPYRKDVLEFGQEMEAERLLQILKSDEMQNRIVDEFNLFENYNIKPEEKYAEAA